MADVLIPDVISSLLDSAAYPHPVDDVEHIETHISHVLLAGEFAYKIKKSVSLGFLDYSTLALRKHFCEEEVRLNTRLCANVYLDTVPVVREGTRYRIGGEGEIVEYAVKMKRVPQRLLLSERIARDEVTLEQARAVAHRLADFHRSAWTDASVATYGRVGAIQRNWTENFEQTQDCVGQTLPVARQDRIAAYVERWLGDKAALIERRADNGRVRDVHGDLRSDSIVIRSSGDICIMDCIEFSDRIRCSDIAGDVGFLAMDLEFRERRDLVDEFVAAYLSDANDESLAVLLDFYRCYRAYVRGKVEWLTRLGCADAGQRNAADARGARYFELADAYASRPRPARIVIMSGLSGTGKSFAASGLAGRLGAALLNTDRLRRSALGLASESLLRGPIDAGAYTPDERRRVYAKMLGEARLHVANGLPVILDATYTRRDDRVQARDLAATLGVPFFAVEVAASDDVVRSRLAARAQQARSTSDADWNVYVAQQRSLEPLDEIAPGQKVRIDGSAPLTSSLDLVTQRIEQAT